MHAAQHELLQLGSRAIHAIALGYAAAAGHHVDAVADSEHLVEPVRYEDDGRAVAQPFDQREDLVGLHSA